MGGMRIWGAITALLSAAACTAQPTQSADPPSGVSVSLHQWRSDEPSHVLEVSVRNNGPTPVRIIDVQLVTSSFITLPPQRVDTVFGRTPRTDIRVPYGTARCDPERVPAVRPATVVAHLQMGDGPAQTVRFAVPHPDPTLAELLAAECGAFILRRSVNVTFGGDWRHNGRALRGVLLVDKKAGADPVTIDDIGGTTHFTLTPLSGRRRPVVVLPPAAARLEIPVELTPARCDAHAFAEAKKAYLFPIWATVGRGERHWLIATPPAAVQAAFLSYAEKTCGLPR